jgi:hypothetical protein
LKNSLRSLLALILLSLIASCGGGSNCMADKIVFGFIASKDCEESEENSSRLEDFSIKIKNSVFFLNSNAIVNQQQGN